MKSKKQHNMSESDEIFKFFILSKWVHFIVSHFKCKIVTTFSFKILLSSTKSADGSINILLITS